MVAKMRAGIFSIFNLASREHPFLHAFSSSLLIFAISILLGNCRVSDIGLSLFSPLAYCDLSLFYNEFHACIYRPVIKINAMPPKLTQSPHSQR